MADVFENLEKDALAHRAIALKLEKHEFFDQAVDECEKSLQLSDSEVSSLDTLTVLARVYFFKKKSTKKAYATVTRALEHRPQEGNDQLTRDVALLIREALIIKGDCERELGMYDEAIASYEEARTICPSEIIHGGVLNAIADCFDEKGGACQLINTLEKWSFWERMAWLIYDSDSEPIVLFQKAVRLSGRESLLVETYTEMIDYLDRSRSSGWPRFQLACAYLFLLDDPKQAKSLFHQILESDSNIDPGTGEEDLTVLFEARLFLAEIAYEEFRTCADPNRKLELLEECKRLQKWEEIGSLRDTNGFESYASVILAIMTRTMGPMQDLQTLLDKTFQACMDALTDTEGWNDSGYLRLLSNVLACVGGLEREAAIAYSAQFSIIDPEVEHEPVSEPEAEESEEDSDSEDEDTDQSKGAGVGGGEGDKEDQDLAQDGMDKENEDGDINGVNQDLNDLDHGDAAADDVDDDHAEDCSDGNGNDQSQSAEMLDEDIAPYTIIQCDGECDQPCVSNWNDGPMYGCIMCSNVDLCQGCYEKRQGYNQTGKVEHWRSYCGMNHRYIKGPITGWKGIKDGVMTIGEEKIRFGDWLKELEEKKWSLAWEGFWTRDNALQDVIV